MLYGLFAGVISLLVIGVFHPVVIKGEYYFGKRVWPLFLVVGIVLSAASVFMGNTYLSIFLGILAFTCFWSIVELFEQEKRVNRGWFPKNPERR
jgi:phosphotransferase system  glucose/maltose/N-acetylglucosamine-specific IIC component